MRFSACACRAEHYQRVRRSQWMKLVPSRRLYHCLACNQMLFIRPDDAAGSPFPETVIDGGRAPAPTPAPDRHHSAA